MPKRWRLDGDAEELTRAIAILQEAVAGAERSRSRGAALTDLAVALSELFEYTGDLRHLDRAIELLDAVEAAEPGADRGNRAALLSRRYEAVGDPADLRAIAALRSASGAALSVRDERQRAAVLLTLHDQDGDPSDLDFAVESAARAVHEAGAAQRASALVNLGTALSGQYAAKGEVADLERAVEAYRDAVARTSQRSPRRALRLADLADAVRERAHRLGRASDLDEAVELLAAALQATPISAPGRPHRQSALATAMLDRCRRSRAGSGSRANDDRSLLDTAIELHRASLAALAKRAPVRFRHQQNLADALADRAVLSGDPDDRAAASLLFHRAFLGAAERDPWAAVVAARNWVRRHRRGRTGWRQHRPI